VLVLTMDRRIAALSEGDPRHGKHGELLLTRLPQPPSAFRPDRPGEAPPDNSGRTNQEIAKGFSWASRPSGTVSNIFQARSRRPLSGGDPRPGRSRAGTEV